MKSEIKEFKRERILNEAVPLFAEFGFQNVTLETIAKRLNVTKPFIYTYFTNKEALLEAIYARAVNSFLSGAREILGLSSPPEEKLRMLVEFFVLVSIKGADVTAIFLTEEKNLPRGLLKKFHAQHHEYDEAFTRLVEEGVKQGVFDVEYPIVASFSITGMIRWLHRWYKPAGRLKPEQVAQQMSKLALNLVGYRAPQQMVQRKRARA